MIQSLLFLWCSAHSVACLKGTKSEEKLELLHELLSGLNKYFTLPERVRKQGKKRVGPAKLVSEDNDTDSLWLHIVKVYFSCT